MNKKVSTLVAALMAAGALVLPKDVFAQIQYANGGYLDQTPASTATAGRYYLVFTEGGKDYVAVVDENNGLKAVEFDKAATTDYLTIGGSTDNFTIKTGNKQLGFSASNVGFGADDKNFKITLSTDNLSTATVIIENKETVDASSHYVGSILRNGLNFTPNAAENKTIKGYLLNSAALEKQADASVAINGEIDLAQGYILFWGNKALEAVEDGKGTAEMQAYDETEANQVWYLEIVDPNAKTARFKNAGTGEYLVQDDKSAQVTITLTGDADNGWTITSPITLTGVNSDMKVNLGNAIEASVKGSELNAHFNGKGFNFAADKDLDDVVIDGDLFGGDTRVFAFTLDAEHKVTTTDNNGQNITFPAGTYFFTKPVFLNGKGAGEVNEMMKTNNSDAAALIDWMNSTFIAVSSTTASEATDSDRKQGEGFDLVEVLGSEFDWQSNGQKPQGSDMDVKNANFTVTKDYTGKYALDLTIYYQPEANYKETDEQKTKTVHLAVESYSKTSQRLVTQLGQDKYVFALASTSVKDGRLLLNDSKTAAVYTIQVVDGPKGFEDFEDKYLTSGKGTSDFQFEVKGAAIYNPEFPAFQWVISDVDDYDKNSKKYLTVTFTNRETNQSFETQLFVENADQNLYSLSTAQLTNVVPFTVKEGAQNTYEVKAQTSKNINTDVIIKLTPVEVDEYAGFYNVDDEVIRTLAFARDKYDTSNKFYATVEHYVDGASQDVYTLDRNSQGGDCFTNDVTSAAEWQLLKVDEKEVSRVFAYNKSVTESVDYVANGDKVKAYVYALRYVVDGTATDYFLKSASTTPRQLVKKANVEDAKDLDLTDDKTMLFVIKENVDGSVSLINAEDAFKTNAKNVTSYNEAKVIEAKLNNNKYVYDFNTENVYTSASGTNDIKTYLDDKHPEISWKAEEGHITLLSEMNNYVNMNENHDAIEVDETKANVYYLHVTDKNAVVPSFYISLGTKEGSNAETERMYMFNPQDSINYYVADGTYDKKYQWSEDNKKLMFKAATMNETRDTLTTNIKGEVKKVAMKADNNDKNVFGGLNRFKFQIVETEDADGYYYIRQTKADGTNTQYLSSVNSKMTWSDKQSAMKFHIESQAAPTSNESVSATEVKVVAQNGSVVVKNAAGKNVVVSTILGQVVANEVLTSDNATINVPAGIVVVAVEGESFKVNVK